MPDNAIDCPTTDAVRIRPEMDFWRLCEQGQRPDLRAFTARAKISNVLELTAVLRMDQRDRWPSGDRVLAESYLEDFPTVRADGECSFELIYSEYLLREEQRERPTSDEYIGRFPEHGARLRMQIDLHLAIDELGNAGRETASRSDTDVLFSLPDDRLRSPQALPTIPGYEIQGLLGRGAMGIVYQARQIGLNRLVALKMMLADAFAHRDHLARFRDEAEAAARLHHPNIVQIYDLGEHEGLPFLSLELVAGGTLADLLAEGPLAPRDVAGLIATLARAIEIAHQRGIIHRDLKPANILLSSTTERANQNRTALPGTNPPSRLSASVAKIADFGLAKLVREGHATQTNAGELLGTPNYMSPEQASGQVHKIGPATDIYALGAILYESLTGQPPFQAPSIVETLQFVLYSEPATVPRLQPRDLATICLKCLEKDQHKRYASAGELADDLERFLADQPIRARRITWFEQVWRWRRRNPIMAGLTALVAALLIAVAGISMLGSSRLAGQLEKTIRAENSERNARHDAQLKLWESYLAEVSARSLSRQVGQRFDALAAVDNARRLLVDIGSTPDRIMRLRNAAISSLALPDLHRANAWELMEKEAPGCGVSAPSTHGLVALVVATGSISVRRQSDFREVARMKYDPYMLPPVISGDGGYVAIHSLKKTDIWRLDNDRSRLAFSLAGAHHPVFAPDEQHVAVIDSDGTMQLYELATAKRVRQLGRGAVAGNCAFHKGAGQVAINGKTSIQIIDLTTEEIVAELPQLHSVHPELVWHPSGKYLAASSNEGIVLWDVAEKRKTMIYAHIGHEMRFAFDEGGEYLFSYTTWNGWANLWHVGTGKQVLHLPNFATHAMGINAAGKLTLHRILHGRLEVWQFDPAKACSFLPLQLAQGSRSVRSLSIAPDNRLLAIGYEEGIELWDLATTENVGQVPLPGGIVHFNDRGDLTVITRDTAVRWRRSGPLAVIDPTSSGEQTSVSFETLEYLPGLSSRDRIGVSSNGQVVLFQTRQSWSIQHLGASPRVTSLKTEGDFRIPDVSLDGRWVALGGWGANGALVFAVETGKLVKHLAIGTICQVQFSPDGRWLGTSRNGIELWRTKDWSSGPKIDASGSAATGLWFTFSPDSRTLAILQPDNAIRLFDLESGRDFAALSEPRMAFGEKPTFSPDGSMLVTYSNHEVGAVRIWNIAVLRRELAQRQLDWDQPPFGAQQETNDRGPLIVNIDPSGIPQKAQVRAFIAAAAKLQATGQFPDALAALRRAVKLDPASAHAHNNLAWLLLTGPIEMRNAAEALPLARQAAELEKGNCNFQNTLGIALFRAGQFSAAIDVFNENQASNPDMPAYDLYFLALCYAHKNDVAKAKAWYRQAEAWCQEHDHRLSPLAKNELAAFRDEADQLLSNLVADEESVSTTMRRGGTVDPL